MEITTGWGSKAAVVVDVTLPFDNQLGVVKPTNSTATEKKNTENVLRRHLLLLRRRVLPFEETKEEDDSTDASIVSFSLGPFLFLSRKYHLLTVNCIRGLPGNGLPSLMNSRTNVWTRRTNNTGHPFPTPDTR